MFIPLIYHSLFATDAHGNLYKACNLVGQKLGIYKPCFCEEDVYRLLFSTGERLHFYKKDLLSLGEKTRAKVVYKGKITMV